MIESAIQLDFIHAGGTLRLLSAGDITDREPLPEVRQNASEWAESGGPWGGATAMGGARAELSFAVQRTHTSHAALRDYCLLAAATLPAGHTGTVRFTVSGGGTWEMADAVVTASAPAPLPESAGFTTLQSFAITGGRPLPTTPVTLFPGVPVELILQSVDTLTLPIENY
jgi:hypothetical protein